MATTPVHLGLIYGENWMDPQAVWRVFVILTIFERHNRFACIPPNLIAAGPHVSLATSPSSPIDPISRSTGKLSVAAGEAVWEDYAQPVKVTIVPAPPAIDEARH
jgi:hypothetical protein